MEKQLETQTGTNDSGVIEIDLVDLLMELLHHWIQIVVAIVILAAVAFAGTKMLITPQYTSTSILYVVSGSSTISLSDLQIGTNLTGDYIQVVSGRPVLDQVSENLGLGLSYSEFSGKVSVTNPDSSRMLNITVTDPDPQMAKTIADEIASVASLYIEQKMGQEPPEIIQYGYVNSSPSSPSVTKNTAMGGLVGAVLAIIIIVIAYLVNDSIMSPEDMEKKVGLQVLASIPLEGSEYNGGRNRTRSTKKEKKKSSGSGGSRTAATSGRKGSGNGSGRK